MDPKIKRLSIIIGAVAAVAAIFIVSAVLIGGGSGKTSANTGSTLVSTQPVTINCIGGSEKTSLMADPQVQKILHDKYGITVNFSSMGSYEQVSLTDDQLKAKGADCLWPASYSAQSVFESLHKTSSYKGYRAETVLQSPEVIYAGPEGTKALIAAGIVQKRENNYYIVDMKKLLVDYVKKGATWTSVGATTLSGPIVVASTDPAKSNSGFTLYQLMLTMLATTDVYTAPSIDQARKAMPEIKALYDGQGLQARSSDAGFDQWLLQGGEAHSPLYAGYESQIIQKVIQYAGNKAVTDQLAKDVVILYPEPTVYSDHPIIALSPDAARLIDAMKDHDIQTIAWKTYGFRSGVEIGLNNVTDFPMLPLAQQLKTTSLPKADVTLLLRHCLIDGVCS
jgi:hypothetical protein